MTSSAIPVEQTDDRMTAAARALCRADTVEVTPVAGGGNNRVFRVLANGETLALKSYPDDNDRRDRLGVEFSSLQFLRRHGVDVVPAALAADPEKGFALYEWIDGVAVETPADSDIDAVLAFIESLIGLAATEEAKALPLATEACLSASEIYRQIDDRVMRLSAAADVHPGLAEFLTKAFLPALETLSDAARRTYDEHDAAFEAEISMNIRTLNPSDFGFHNTLRTPIGDIAFLDFEYFGWDDPVKLASDFLLHPGHRLDGHTCGRFLRGVDTLFGGDPAFEWRLRALYPIYGLRWCLIIVSEFLPERMARRQRAGRHADPAAARQIQLEKAGALLGRILATEGALPDGR